MSEVQKHLSPLLSNRSCIWSNEIRPWEWLGTKSYVDIDAKEATRTTSPNDPRETLSRWKRRLLWKEWSFCLIKTMLAIANMAETVLISQETAAEIWNQYTYTWMFRGSSKFKPTWERLSRCSSVFGVPIRASHRSRQCMRNRPQRLGFSGVINGERICALHIIFLPCSNLLFQEIDNSSMKQG